MKRKNRKAKKNRKIHSKKRPPFTRVKKHTQKRSRVNRKRSVAPRKRGFRTDPRVARALGFMRREGASSSVAARRERMKLSTFRRGAGKFLYRSGPGKPWKARSEDQLSFSMEVLTRQGRISAIVRNSGERKLLHEYEIALNKFRGAEEGAEEGIKRFEGKTVGGHQLITDTKLLMDLEEADEIDFESIYSPFKGQS